jgi:hypothetical protein
MAKWRKRFRAWVAAKQPVSVEEVESLVFRIFGERVRVQEGGSHRWNIEVPELKGTDTYQWGNIEVPVKNGRTVIARYLKLMYRASVELGLFEEDEDGQDDNDDDES